MVESILLVLWVGTTLFFGFREYKEAKDRESHEWWLSDVRDCIHSIECEFRWDCEKIAEEEFSQQKFSIFTYNAKISELEKAYKKDLTEKVVAKKFVRITTIPDHLIREYEQNISDIAGVFRYFSLLR